jgi:hypothetical protein
MGFLSLCKSIMPGISDKLKKFGQNLWQGINTGWNAVKTFAPAVLNTVSPMLGPQGQRIADTIGKGIDMCRRIEGTLAPRGPANVSAVRRVPPFVNQPSDWGNVGSQ